MKKNILRIILFIQLFILGHISCTGMTTYSDRTRRSSSQSIVDQILNNNDLSLKTTDQIQKELAKALSQIDGEYSNQIPGFKQLLGVIAASGIVSNEVQISDNIIKSNFDPLMIELRAIAEKLRSEADLINESFLNRENDQINSKNCIEKLQFIMQMNHEMFSRASQYYRGINLQDISPDTLNNNFNTLYNSILSERYNSQIDGCPIFHCLYYGGDEYDGPFVKGSTRLTGIYANAMVLSMVEATITAQVLQNALKKTSLITTFPAKLREVYNIITRKFNEIQTNLDRNMIHNLKTIFSQETHLSNLKQAYKIMNIIKVAFPEYEHLVLLWDDSDGNSQIIQTYQGLEKMRVNYIQTKDYGYSQKKFIVLVQAERKWAISDKSGDERAFGAFNTYLTSFTKYGNAFNGEGITPYEFAVWNNNQHLRSFNASPYWMVGYCIVKKNLNFVWADTNPDNSMRYMHQLDNHANIFEGVEYWLAYWG